MSDAISVQCPKCHAKLKLTSRHPAGKKVKCPKCERPFVVAPPPDEEDELAFLHVDEPAPRPSDEPYYRSPFETATDDPWPQSATARPAGEKRPTTGGDWHRPVMIGVVSLAIVAVLAGTGFVVADLLGGYWGRQLDLAYLPPDADVIVQVRVSEVVDAPLARTILSGPDAKGQFDRLKQAYGVDPATIRSLTLAFGGYNDAVHGLSALQNPAARRPRTSGAPLAVLRSTTSLDLEKLKSGAGTSEAATHAGMTYFRAAKPDSSASVFAICLPISTTLIMGPEDQVKRAIERGTGAARRSDLDFADASRQIVVAFAPRDPAGIDSINPAGMLPGGASTLSESLRGKIRGVCLGINLSDKVDWAVQVNCTSGDSADEVSGELDKALQDVRTKLGEFKSTAPPKMVELALVADSAIKSVRVTSKGDVIKLAGQIPGGFVSQWDQWPGMIAGGLSVPGSAAAREIPRGSVSAEASESPRPGAFSHGPNDQTTGQPGAESTAPKPVLRGFARPNTPPVGGAAPGAFSREPDSSSATPPEGAPPK